MSYENVMLTQMLARSAQYTTNQLNCCHELLIETFIHPELTQINIEKCLDIISVLIEDDYKI